MEIKMALCLEAVSLETGPDLFPIGRRDGDGRRPLFVIRILLDHQRLQRRGLAVDLRLEQRPQDGPLFIDDPEITHPLRCGFKIVWRIVSRIEEAEHEVAAPNFVDVAALGAEQLDLDRERGIIGWHGISLGREHGNLVPRSRLGCGPWIHDRPIKARPRLQRVVGARLDVGRDRDRTGKADLQRDGGRPVVTPLEPASNRWVTSVWRKE
jgi:hypothetical protein